ncbi:hypothetical protein L7F22_068851 [Adiantum nelumboides]|nr:hypothetical protein [Adiantum nelumboides]
MEVRTALMAALLVCMCRSAFAKYENFTVGDAEGWTAKPSVSYTKWASNKTFSLGDYLIFNFADSEYDVIQTLNETVYKDCDYMNSDGDFEVWGESETTMASAIPLVHTGPNYFFCGVNNSELCKQGMKFGINVTEGDGLPPSLAIPPPAPVNETVPSVPSGPSGDGDGYNDNDDNGAPYLRSFRSLFLVALLVPVLLN